jgi:hypothetical protein
MDRRVRGGPAVAVLTALLAIAASPTAVHAECTQFDRWPSFGAAARSADVIVIGRVSEGYDEDSAGNYLTFVLRVDETLRGRPRDVLDFHDVVRSGLPLKVCRDSLLRARVGDRLAFAFGARYSGVSNPVTAIAFLNRTPDAFLMPGVERLTADEVKFVSSLPQTDTERADHPPGIHDPGIPLVLGVGAGLLSLRLRRWARYPDGRWPSSSRPSATNAVSGTRV